MTEAKLTSKQAIFARHYAETNDAVEAYKAAYPDSVPTTKYLSNAASGKLNNPRVKSLVEEIQQGMRAQFVMLAPDALNNIIHLANHAESEKVKLEANREILYGAGLKPPEEVQLKAIGVFGSASPEEIRDLIRASLEEDVVEGKIIEEKPKEEN